MKQYAKLVDTKQLTYAPKTVTLGATHYNPTPEWWLAENGYLPVVRTGLPEYDAQTQIPIGEWVEQNGEIVTRWYLEAIPEETESEPNHE